MAVVNIIDTVVALRRIHGFLEAEEVEELKTDAVLDDGVVIALKGASFEWETGDSEHNKASCSCKKVKKAENEIEMEDLDAQPWRLHDISLEIEKGKLTMIIGKVGSGKSSLLSAFLGEMTRLSGTCGVSGSVAYCPQVPWIQNATLKDNITFGLEEDEEFLSEVIGIASLKQDLEVLQGGLEISIGERGINLSGGQKYRVSLARSCYRSSLCDLYLLDDPLGAVDAHVGRSLLEDCLCGFLKDKTRVVVTHQLQHLDHADYVVLMDEGRIVEKGTYDELMNIEGGRVRALVSEHVVKKRNEVDEDDDLEENEETPVVSKTQVMDENEVKKTPKKEVNEEEGEDENGEEEEGEDEKKPKDIMKAEEKAEGCVACRVIVRYARSTGCKGFPCFLMIVVSILAQTLLTLMAWWLGVWSNGTFSEQFGTIYTTSYYNEVDLNMTEIGVPQHYANNGTCPVALPLMCFQTQVDVSWMWFSNGTLLRSGLDPYQSVAIYTALGIAAVLIALVRDLLVLHCTVNASNRIHNEALRRVAHSPMSWFDTTPVGRIISRLTVDIMMMDWLLPVILTVFFSTSVRMIASLVFVGVLTNGLFLAVIVPVAIAFFVFYLLYRRVSVEWKRIQNLSRSPVVARFSESLVGRSTIRAFRREEDFHSANIKTINEMNRAIHIGHAGRAWIGTSLGLVSIAMTLVVGILCISFAYYFPDSFAVALPFLSLAVSRSLTSSGLITRTLEYATQTEALMSSVERLDHFARDLTTEEEIHEKLLVERGKKAVVPPPKWPSEGTIVLNEFGMRYREDLPLVLRDMSLSIKAAEKVGVVGRTGSGKSSLMLGLFRMVEGDLGSISIDGVDIACIPIHTLRSKLSMIPQDPTLFEGTVRSNMDPFEDCSDVDIWNALERSYMKKKIQDLGGLDVSVEESGSNFSVGEKQLLCLARALLRQAKILLLDEVTASVDLRTDMKIQKTVREAFVESTVITIAHRVRTIIDSDRIVVLDDGQVVEFDTPRVLLGPSPPDGAFAKLVQEDGPESAAFLVDVAFGRREMRFDEEEEAEEEEGEVEEDEEEAEAVGEEEYAEEEYEEADEYEEKEEYEEEGEGESDVE